MIYGIEFTPLCTNDTFVCYILPWELGIGARAMLLSIKRRNFLPTHGILFSQRHPLLAGPYRIRVRKRKFRFLEVQRKHVIRSYPKISPKNILQKYPPKS